MTNNIQEKANKILSEVKRKARIEEIVSGSEVEVEIAHDNSTETYTIKINTQKQELGKKPNSINLYSEKIKGEGIFVFNLADNVSKGLIAEKYISPVNITYMRAEDKKKLGIGA
jgi:hypothetical protein